jgi:hypothetical protein
MSTGRRLAVAGVVAAAVALAPAGVASADNSNSNTNTNDVTQFGGGDLSAGQASGNENTNWPPTDSDWPPQDILGSGESETGGNGTGGNKARGESASAPIVMPSGQSSPGTTQTPATPEAPKPIVDASSP